MPATVARAAQDATVIVNQASIRERPDLDAKVIEAVPMGTKLRVSSRAKDGWFKTRPTIGGYGWVWQSEVLVKDSEGDVHAASLDMRQRDDELRYLQRDEPMYFVRGAGIFFPMFAPQLSARLGKEASDPYFSSGGFLEGAYRLNPKLRASARFMTYLNERSIVFNGIPYEVESSGTSFTLGLEAEFGRTNFSEFYCGVRLGYAFINKLRVSVPAAPTPNAFEISSTWPALMVHVSWSYRFTRLLSLYSELGLYYSEVSTFTVPNQFNADDAFRDSADKLATLRVSHIGPMLSVGVMLSF